MTKHTPGPWQVTGPDDDPYDDITVRHEHRKVCHLWQDNASVHNYTTEQWANARLISAAPDLLEACMGMLKHIDDVLDDDDLMCRRTAIVAAIFKATGATP